MKLQEEAMVIPYSAFEDIPPGLLDAIAYDLEERGEMAVSGLLTAMADTLDAHLQGLSLDDEDEDEDEDEPP